MKVSVVREDCKGREAQGCSGAETAATTVCTLEIGQQQEALNNFLGKGDICISIHQYEVYQTVYQYEVALDWQ